MTSKNTAVSVANAKREFSDLLGRVAYGRETILITRRGRPMAKLVPVDAETDTAPDPASRGWLEEDDSFFEVVEEIVNERQRHRPRVLPARKRSRQVKKAG